MDIENAVEVLDEELGAAGIARIENKIKRIAKANKVKGKITIKQEGPVIVIFKDKKKYASIPMSKAFNDNYLESTLTKKDF